MNAALNFAVFSLSMAAATVLLFVLSRLAGKRFSSRCKYALWAVIVIRMCLPLTFLPTLMTYETAYVSETAEEISPEAAFVAPSSASASAGPGTSDEGTPTARSDASAVGHEKKQTPKIPNADVLIPAAYFGISALIFSAQLSMYGISMRKLRRSLREPDKKTVKKYLRIAEEEGVRRAPALFVSDLVSGPLLCGFFRRKIVITEAALSPAVLDGVLRHELTHHKRGDLVMKLAGTVCLSLHFLNPAAYFAVGMLDREMEYSCDERVLSGCGTKKRGEYGLAVLDVMRSSQRRSHGAAMTTEFSGGQKELGRRFRLIMDGGKKKRGTAVVAVALLICFIAGSAVSFKAAAPDKTESSPLSPIGVSDGSETKPEPADSAPALSETEPTAGKEDPTGPVSDPKNPAEPGPGPKTDHVIATAPSGEPSSEPDPVPESEATAEPDPVPETETIKETVPSQRPEVFTDAGSPPASDETDNGSDSASESASDAEPAPESDGGSDTEPPETTDPLPDTVGEPEPYGDDYTYVPVDRDQSYPDSYNIDDYTVVIIDP